MSNTITILSLLKRAIFGKREDATADLAKYLASNTGGGGGGTGDMLKSVYDTNDDGVVDSVPLAGIVGSTATGRSLVSTASASAARTTIGAASQTPIVPTVVAATATTTTTSINASQGNLFRITLQSNTTLSITSPTDGQVLQIELIQDATGGRTVALATGVGGFIFSDSNPSSLFVTSTSANKKDKLTCRYASASQRWEVEAFAAGY
ncbi:MAG: hypothetical protein KatS3mg087_0530 [Patescibacteria group bacterium]|nr:MAG: hypothetical protein KatS3mg087_0530 [Patescibacteria group bacterium]